jgi:NAD(P)-dependent dehydrogenase (short-subunit alcohol dehydrogenase family)
MPIALVTGASRGIGLEFVRQYAAAGWRVIACCRSPGSSTELQALAKNMKAVTMEALDITDHRAIDGLARRRRGVAIDVLINNAGIMGALPFRENLHRQHFGSVDYALWDEVFRTNTLGTVKMTEAFIEHVAASHQRKVISLSSTTGSISESRREALAYTTSKTALNKAMTVIAEHLRPRGVIVSLLCPGYVKTRMNVGGAAVEITDSVSAMRRLIEAFTLADSGTFRRYNGESIAW